MHNRRFLVCPDTSPDAGLGHLQRCLGLAKAIRDLGVECIFSPSAHAVATERISIEGFPVVTGSALDGFDVAITVAAEAACSALIIDSYRLAPSALASMREAGLFVVAIDDLAAFPFISDVVINGAIHAPTLPYVSAGSDTTFLLGTSFLLTAQAFSLLPVRSRDGDVGSVLITLGGSDPSSLTGRIIRATEVLPRDVHLDVVVGPFMDARPIEKAAAACRHDVTLIDGASAVGVYDAVRRADVAVCGGGQTSYELAAAGVPCVGIEVASNQSGSIRGLANAGSLLFAGSANGGRVPAEFTSCLVRLAAAPALRRSMSIEGRRLVDGRGAIRAARATIERMTTQT